MRNPNERELLSDTYAISLTAWPHLNSRPELVGLSANEPAKAAARGPIGSWTALGIPHGRTAIFPFAASCASMFIRGHDGPADFVHVDGAGCRY